MQHAVSDQQWFDSLSEQYVAETANYAPIKAFNGMAEFSFYDGAVNPLWLMSHAERGALYLLMLLIRPKVVIEIGARFAGSTFIFSRYAEKVYAVDIDPALVGRCKHLKNVEVLIGDSKKILPTLVQKLTASGEGWDFALVDGDHSTDAVRNDLDALIKTRPIRRAWIAMHDSFNPGCRKGIIDANWNAPWVHCVDIDFVCGQLKSEPHMKNEMWGGMSLAEIGPQDRPSRQLTIKKDSTLMYEVAYQSSVHRPRSFAERAIGKARRLLHL